MSKKTCDVVKCEERPWTMVEGGYFLCDKHSNITGGFKWALSDSVAPEPIRPCEDCEQWHRDDEECE